MKYINWSLALFLFFSVAKATEENYPFFPIGAWGIHVGNATDVNDAGFVLSKAGINILISDLDYPTQKDYWMNAAKTYDLKLNVRRPKWDCPYLSGFYDCLYILCEYYPVHKDEDSLAFWRYLKDKLVTEMNSNYQNDSVYSSWATFFGFCTQQVRKKM